jgi:hypothetical protein
MIGTNVYLIGTTCIRKSKTILKVLDNWLPDPSLRVKNDIRDLGFGWKNYFIEGPTSDGRYITVSARNITEGFDTEKSFFVHVRGKILSPCTIAVNLILP